MSRQTYGVAGGAARNTLWQFVHSVQEYRRSAVTVVTVTVVGLLVAFGAREMLRRDDDTMNAGMAILLTLCASYVQFAGSQECYSARSNAVQAFTLLEQACLYARLGRCQDHMLQALTGRRRAANRERVEQLDDRGVARLVDFEYRREADFAMERMARTSDHAAAALERLAGFDMLCRLATPRTMVQPINDMIILTFAFVMPLTIFPVMGWWYLLFALYPTYICIGGFQRMCEAGNFLSSQIPEYDLLFAQTVSSLEAKMAD